MTDGTRFFWKIFFIVVAAILIMTVIAWPLGLLDRVANPDRAVGSYERFFNRCASVQSLETQRDALLQQLESTDEEDTDELSRIRSALTGVRSQRARAINSYNADAANVTRSWLRSERLPPRLDESQEYTECAR